MDDVTTARQRGPTIFEMPHIETTRKVVQHYNGHDMDAFDLAKYFIFNGVKVFVKGQLVDPKPISVYDEPVKPK